MGWRDDPLVEEAPSEPKAQAKSETRPIRSSLTGGMTAARSAFPPRMMESLRPVGEFVGPSVLPTAGSLALPAAATAIAGPANVPFIPLEQGLGSGIGEGINQLTGITKPSLTQLGLAAGVPTALGYGASGIRALSKFFPPSKGAETVNALAAPEALSKVAGYRSGQDVGKLFETATKQGVTVPLSKTEAMVQQIKQEVANATPAGQKAWQTILKDTGMENLATTPGGVSPAQLQHVLADVGRLYKKASSSVSGDPLKTDKLGKLFATLSADADAVPGLVAARSLFKREKVLDEIGGAVADAFQINRGQGAAAQFNANKVVNTLQDSTDTLGKYFAQAFSKGEQKEIVEFFKFLNTIPALKAGAGQTTGSSRVIARAIAPIGAGSAVGLATTGGNPLGAAVGATVGAAMPPIAESSKMLLQAWRMEGGRDLIKGLLKNSDGALTPQVIGAVGAFLSGQTAARPTQPSNVIRPPTGLPQAFQTQP